MTRNTLFSALSCAALLAAIAAGCGSSSPAGNSKDGGAGSGGAGTTGSAGSGGAGTTGTAGTDGGAGTTGSAGTGSDAGAGTTGAAGTDGGAGTGAAGTGSDGGAGTGAAGSDAGSDVKAEAGSDAAAPVCGDGNLCNDNGSTCETACVRGRRSFCACYDPAGGPMRLEYSCFTDVACTSTTDGGTDAATDAGSTDAGTTTDAGTDGGVTVRACPAGVMTGDSCSADGGGAASICATACTNNQQRTCTCGRNGWNCSRPHICLN